jgi:small-conductance mechanosensitive channel
MVSFVESLFDHEVFANPVVRWSTALGVIAVVSLVLAGVKHLVARRLESLSEHRTLATLRYAAGIVKQTSLLLYLPLGGWLAMPLMELQAGTAGKLHTVFMVMVFLQVGRWAGEGVNQAVEHYRAQANLEEDPSRTTALSAMGVVGKILVWAAVLLLIIDNLGFDITALVASLGIGGIAIALAVQNILGDLFASLSIIVDKPFVNGDFIIVGDYMGTVEQIGMKTTRMRSLGGEQLIFSNQDLLQSRIRNYRRMEERRVVFELGVTYQTETEHIREIPEMIGEIIESTETTRFDRAHFNQFGDSALQFEVVYWVLSPDYAVFMDLHQSIILELLERLREQDIEIAYPTQTIHVDGAETGGSAGGPETSLHGDSGGGGPDPETLPEPDTSD